MAESVQTISLVQSSGGSSTFLDTEEGLLKEKGDCTTDGSNGRSKHKEAALLVKQGKDHERLDSLKGHALKLIAYKILHHPVYYWLALLAACSLLLLTVFEQESTFTQEHERVDKAKHLASELILLTFFVINLLLRVVWLGPKLFFKSRAILLCIIIIVMYLEISTIFISNNRHIRITRALRPFILLDTYLMFGARRVVRQIFICLKYIIDVMLVLFFLVAVFSLVGYFLFTNINPTYFDSLTESVVSMIITLTTANHPDVFMESYYKNAATPIFFMVYMFVTFYYFNNVLLAVVFAKFKAAEKKKFKKLFLHEREALRQAFNILKENDLVRFVDFLIFMRIYAPRAAQHEVMCLFKALQTSNDKNAVSPTLDGEGELLQTFEFSEQDQPTHSSGEDDDDCLTWSAFSNFYEYENMKWELIHKTGMAVTWYEKINRCHLNVKIFLYYIHFAVEHRLCDFIISAVVIANLLYLIIFISLHEESCNDSLGSDQFCSARLGIIGSFVFNSIYLVEVNVKLFLDGPIRYFRKSSNWFDYILVMGSFVCLCIEISLINHDLVSTSSFRYIAMVRPLKLLRLLHLKKNYFYLIRIMGVLAGRLTSVLFLLVIVFYFFSIIGMEVFTGPNAVHAGCCVNASFGVGEYYSNNGSIPDSPDLYWLNNFDSIGRSFVTLYEEMVVNNWFIQMEGFVSTTSQAARLYFILFWMSTTLVVNIAIVYIVDAFESGILVLKLSTKEKDQDKAELEKDIRVTLTNADTRLLDRAIKQAFLYNKEKQFSINKWIRRHYNIPVRTIIHYKGEFRGKRLMDNDDLRVIIYENELEEWKTHFDEECSKVKSTKEDSCKDICFYIGRKLKRLIFYILS